MADFLRKKIHHRTEDKSSLLKLDFSLWSISFYILWILHIIFNIIGWTALWSTTYYEVVSEPVKDFDGLSDPLYKATFWTNVREFWENDAQAISVVTVIAGFVQPIIKQIAFLGIAFLPMTPSFRERAITLQETSSKLSLTPFYVEALILMAFSYEMTITPLNTMVKIWIKINPGMMFFFFGQAISMLIINILRINHRRSEDHRGYGASDVRSSMAGSGVGGSSSLLQSSLNKEFTTQEQAFHEIVHGNKNGNNKKPIINYDGYKQETDDSGWIQQDSRDKQFKRDLRRAIVVVPAAILTNGLFFYLYFTPFIQFEATGILSRFITENGPVSKYSFQNLADGLFMYAHPWSYALVFAISLYLMLFAIPFSIPFCAGIDALLPLFPHWANRRDGGRDSMVGRMRSSSIVQTLSDDSWVIDVRFALREAVQIFSTWGTAEAAVIGCFFTVPNITNIAHWMFDDRKPCPEIEAKTDSIETCITVKSHLIAGPGIALVAWVFLLVILGRIILDGQKGLSFLIVADDSDEEVDDDDIMHSAHGHDSDEIEQRETTNQQGSTIEHP